VGRRPMMVSGHVGLLKMRDDPGGTASTASDCFFRYRAAMDAGAVFSCHRQDQGMDWCWAISLKEHCYWAVGGWPLGGARVHDC